MAYYLSCLELITEAATNHPELAIFDEPGQQEIEAASLFEFLRSAARSAATGQQMIVSTSETFDAVSSALNNTANIVSFPAFILQPLHAAPAPARS